MILKKLLTEDLSKTISGVDLGTLLLDTYIKYPFAPYKQAAIPYNYCALPRKLGGSLASIAMSVLTPFCGEFPEQQSKGISDL